VCFCQTAAVGEPILNATISYPILRELVLQAGDGSSHMRCRSEPQANLASRDVEMSSFVFQIVFAQVPRCFRQVTCPYPKARLVLSTYIFRQQFKSTQHLVWKAQTVGSTFGAIHYSSVGPEHGEALYQCYCAMILIWQIPLTTLPS